MLMEELGAGNIFLGFFTFFGELNLIFFAKSSGRRESVEVIHQPDEFSIQSFA